MYKNTNRKKIKDSTATRQLRSILQFIRYWNILRCALIYILLWHLRCKVYDERKKFLSRRVGSWGRCVFNAWKKGKADRERGKNMCRQIFINYFKRTNENATMSEHSLREARTRGKPGAQLWHCGRPQSALIAWTRSCASWFIWVRKGFARTSLLLCAF